MALGNKVILQADMGHVTGTSVSIAYVSFPETPAFQRVVVETGRAAIATGREIYNIKRQAVTSNLEGRPTHLHASKVHVSFPETATLQRCC